MHPLYALWRTLESSLMEYKLGIQLVLKVDSMYGRITIRMAESVTPICTQVHRLIFSPESPFEVDLIFFKVSSKIFKKVTGEITTIFYGDSKKMRWNLIRFWSLFRKFLLNSTGNNYLNFHNVYSVTIDITLKHQKKKSYQYFFPAYAVRRKWKFWPFEDKEETVVMRKLFLVLWENFYCFIFHCFAADDWQNIQHWVGNRKGEKMLKLLFSLSDFMLCCMSFDDKLLKLWNIDDFWLWLLIEQ